MQGIMSSLARATRIALTASLLSGLYMVAAEASPALDFGYTVDGPAAIRPVLVFNDGVDTYIQPAEGVNTAVRGAVHDGPYWRLSGIPDSITAQVGRVSVQISRATVPNAPQSGDTTALRHDAERAEATAERLTAMGIGSNETLLSEKEVQALATQSLARPNAASLHTGDISGQSVLDDRGSKFTLLKSDVTVFASFQRWARLAGWTVEWDSAISAVLAGDTSVSGTLPEAVTKTIEGLRKVGYPLWVSEPDLSTRSIRVYQTASSSSIDEVKK